MKILFIAPLPPPVTGHSLASKVFFDSLLPDHSVRLVNLSKRKSGPAGRIAEISSIIAQVYRKQRGSDRIYFTISESLGGNLKDLLIYVICFGRLSHTYIHLHGGSIKRLLWDKKPLVFGLNKFFISRMRGVIISGKSHEEVFRGIVPEHKIHISPNFAPDYLFLDAEDLNQKFDRQGPIRILYMSSMKKMKGYEYLLDAYLQLTEAEKKNIVLDFAGGFESEPLKKIFLEKIKDQENIRYHGIVDDDVKRTLFINAQVFCLPTGFLEGQPISILEAYAAGCVVVATTPPGILDIFTPGENGYAIDRTNIGKSLNDLLTQLSKASLVYLANIAQHNASQARSTYREKSYTSSLTKIIAENP